MRRSQWFVVLFLIVVGGLWLSLSSFTRTDAQNLDFSVYGDVTGGWEITTIQAGQEYSSDALQATEGTDTAVLRQIVPESWAEYQRVLVSNYRAMVILVDDAVVFSTIAPVADLTQGLPELDAPLDAPFDAVFSVNPSWVGKTMSIYTRTFRDTPFPSIGFGLQRDSVYETQGAAAACANALPGMAFGMLALFLLGLFLYGCTERRRNYPQLLLSLAALLQMAFYFDGIETNPLFSQYYPVMQSLYVFATTLYVGMNLKKGRKLFFLLLSPVWLIYFVFVLLYLLPEVITPTWINWIFFAPFVLLAAVLTFSIYAAVQKNRYYRRFLRLTAITVVGGAALLGIAALLHSPMIDTMTVYFLELQAGYPQPVITVLFTGLLLIEFVQSSIEVVEDKVDTAKELEAVTLRSELTAQSLTASKHANEALAVARHDEMHHLRTAAALLSEDPGKAKAYLNSIVSDLAAIPAMRFTENRLINAILSVQSSEAAKAGVAFQAKAIVPETLPLPDLDVSTVLMNLLENAVTAAANAADGAERLVSATLEMEDDTLLITITNSLPSGFDKEHFRSRFFHTTKTDTAKHGYGIRSAQRIVTRYGGELAYNVQEDQLTLNTVMRV